MYAIAKAIEVGKAAGWIRAQIGGDHEVIPTWNVNRTRRG